MLASLTGCVAPYRWVVQESGRADGVYGDWVTREKVSDFGSYSYSTAKGVSADRDFGASPPRIVVQDDFVIKMFVGDDFICDSSHADTIWYVKDEIVLRERLYMRVAPDSKNHFQWIGTDSSVTRFMHMLRIYDKLAVRYTDSCGKQRTITFAIAGSHHNETMEIAPNGD